MYIQLSLGDGVQWLLSLPYTVVASSPRRSEPRSARLNTPPQVELRRVTREEGDLLLAIIVLYHRDVPGAEIEQVLAAGRVAVLRPGGEVDGGVGGGGVSVDCEVDPGRE